MGVKVYLAGPGVFRADAAEQGARLKAACAQLGLEGAWPADGVEPDWDAARIKTHCRTMIDGCDAAIADFSPFRGTGADCGTAWEAGYFEGRGKPVFGYSTDQRTLAARVSEAFEVVRSADGCLRDGDGMMVEDAGRRENAMLDPGPDALDCGPAQALARVAGHFGVR